MLRLLKVDPTERIAVYRVKVHTIRGLRHRLLRAGLPPESAHFKGDDEPSTRHFGLFYPVIGATETALNHGDNAMLVCCASFMFEPYRREPAWHLRALCTDPRHQRKGFGATLLTMAEKITLELLPDINLFWCNIPLSTIDFFTKQGWTVDSGQFRCSEELHVNMAKRL